MSQQLPSEKAPDDGSTEPVAPAGGMGIFVQVLVNTAFANLTTSFLWWSLTFWIYEQTRNVIATGVIGGSYLLFIALFSLMFGTLVDRYRKKSVMFWSTMATLVVFAADAVFFFTLGEAAFVDLSQPWFWIFAVVMLVGAVVEHLRSIALSTTVTLLVPVERRANANGLVGTVQGLTFLVTGVFSGLVIGRLGMGGALLIALVALSIALIHLFVVRVPEAKIVQAEGHTKFIDVVTGYRTVRAAKGLMTLIVLTAVNNLFGGVFMALMDPYGIDMFGVEMWGIWFAVASTGFIVGGTLVAKLGLGKNPVRTMLLLCGVMGVIGAVFALREWAWLYIIGIWVYMMLVPAVEAAEQTLIQSITPYQKQGRVFGFAMTFETAAAPIASFAIAPIAEVWIIPYMNSPSGQESWSWLLGEGQSRGIALTFLISGLLTIALVVVARFLPVYRLLGSAYQVAIRRAAETGISAAESEDDVLAAVSDSSGADTQLRREVQEGS